MTTVTVTRPEFPPLFGGFGFHNSEALMYRLIAPEQFAQKICKCYRELSPGFMRTFGGLPNWSRENMDSFAEYYAQMQQWTETPIYFAAAKGQVHFSEDERERYADQVAERLQYLIEQKNVRQLRYYCFSNELSYGDWGGFLQDMPLFHHYQELLFRAFQRRNLNIALLAPDASNMNNWPMTLDYVTQHMRRITEDICLHAYIMDVEPDDPAFYQSFYDRCRDAVMQCIRCDGKRLILGEFGIKGVSADCWAHRAGAIQDVCSLYRNDARSAQYALQYAEAAIAAINAGVFAMVIWTFSDYPDPYVCHYNDGSDPYAAAWAESEPFVSGTHDVKYNKCGLIKWEDNGDYTVRDAYYCLGLLARYCRRNAKVLAVSADDPLLRCTGLLSRDGTWSVLVLNRHDDPQKIDLRMTLPAGYAHDRPVRVYEYNSRAVNRNEFGDLPDPVAVLDGESMHEVPGQSLTVFTTDYCDYPEIWADGVRSGTAQVQWNAVTHPKHCYYRVYRGEIPDFVPDASNQIASTVAESLDLTQPYPDHTAIHTVPGDYYKVRSVPKVR